MMPSVFVSHGAPTLLLDDTPTRTFLQQLGRELPRPSAVLCVSAHWEATPPRLTGSPRPQTVHDFYGFPAELYEQRYPAPGDPALAGEVATLLEQAGFNPEVDGARGLDHGAWVPLRLMYPQADVPVVQLSLQTRIGPEHHLALGRALMGLRERDVLVLGSGGATHNLADFRRYALDAPAVGYAREFDLWLEQAIAERDEDALVQYERGPHGRRNHPTPEHYLPLLVACGAGSGGGRRLHDGFTYGVLSMAAYAWD